MSISGHESWNSYSGTKVQLVFFLCVWLTVHCSSMWNKKPTRCHLALYLFLLYTLLNMFRATLCPSPGADNLVVFLPRLVSAVAV